MGRSVQQTIDGGYVVAGSHGWFDPEGKSDGFVLKTDPMGILLWEKTFGGEDGDAAFSVQ